MYEPLARLRDCTVCVLQCTPDAHRNQPPHLLLACLHLPEMLEPVPFLGSLALPDSGQTLARLCIL